MKKLTGYLVLTLLLLAAPLAARAQGSSTMRFEHEIWDFGRIAESDGKVTHRFEFTNTGDKPFVIEHISVSCGCTNPEFTKKPVQPGEKGYVDITYDPRNRPGVFLQTIQIRSNGGKNNNLIKIKGEVSPRPRTAEEAYQFSSRSGIRYNTMALNYRYLEPGTSRSMTIGYINNTGKDVSFGYEVVPESRYLTVEAPQSICAGCTGEITVTYEIGDGVYGRFADRIYTVVDGNREPLPFTTTAIAVDKMTGIDERKAPKAELTPMFYNFGEVKQGAVVSRSFRLSNSGKSPMTVRWVGGRAYVSTTLEEGTVIQPGKSVDFEVTMDTSEASRGGVFTGSLSFIVNDPIRPLREVRVSANVR